MNDSVTHCVLVTPKGVVELSHISSGNGLLPDGTSTIYWLTPLMLEREYPGFGKPADSLPPKATRASAGME